MSMQPSLGLNVSQNLVMTPQLQQAIYLLQLSSLDLQQEIQQALEENPLLELEEEHPQEAQALDPFDTSSREAQKNLEQHESDPSEMQQWDEQNLPEQLAVDTAWEDIYIHETSHGMAASTEDFNNYETDTYSASLADHLNWQVNLNIHSEDDRLIAATLVDSINPDGYLLDSLEAITQGLQNNYSQFANLTLAEVHTVLKLIQSFDPAGVGSRNLQECLTLQLAQLDAKTPYLRQAKRLVEQYLEVLAAKDYRFLMRRLQLKHEEELQEVIELIQSLNPRPGSSIESEAAAYIVPDLLLSKTKHGWLVELNPDTLPRLRVQANYSQLVATANSEAKDYLRGQHRDAQWLIKSLQNRGETLLKVGTEIVTRQQEFFEKGEEFMLPLVLADLATSLDMHESTISRATNQKYMHTPRGIFELKYFFSSHVATSSGGEASSTAIRALIKKLIAEEPPKKPLSDNKIASLLEETGIQIARRTVAKYRESMQIPASSDRKRLI